MLPAMNKPAPTPPPQPTFTVQPVANPVYIGLGRSGYGAIT